MNNDKHSLEAVNRELVAKGFPPMEDAASIITRFKKGEIVPQGEDESEDEDLDCTDTKALHKEYREKFADEHSAKAELLERAAAKHRRSAAELGNPASRLPAIQDAARFVGLKLETPRELVHGILHQASKLVVGGQSKARKTWLFIDLALAVAFGEPWLSFKTNKGSVLYVNLEIQPAFFQTRIQAVARAKNITLRPGSLDIWNLRGATTSYAELLERIAERAADRAYALIIIDPLYKLLGQADENSARDIANLLNRVEQLANDTGAAVAFAAHFSKGNQASKNSIDRISGSGVFARDPDSILTFTEHQDEGCFTVESTVRNLPPVQSFVARWDFPVFRRATDLDPKRLKQAKGGRPPTCTADELAALLTGKELTTGDWQQLADQELGLKRTGFYDARKQLVKAGKVTSQDDKWKLAHVHP